MGAAQPKRGILADRTEGAVAGEKTARRLLAEPGPRCRIDHQAGLISVLCRRRPGDHLHRLDSVGWNRCRKNFVPLVGYRLAIDYVAYLCMIAQGMKEAVGIGG